MSIKGRTLCGMCVCVSCVSLTPQSLYQFQLSFKRPNEVRRSLTPDLHGTKLCITYILDYRLFV